MRVLLIEDDRDLADFVSRGLEEDGLEVTRCADGREGLRQALKTRHDCLIVDLMLPELDGFSLIQVLRDQGVRTPILIVSARQEVESRVAGLRTGGDDYLVKPFSLSELQARVSALIRRARGYSEPTRLSCGDLSLDLVTRRVQRQGQTLDLQNRELELLIYLLRNQGRIVSKRAIIAEVWDFDFDPGTNIVEARMSKLREKVDKPFREKLIHTIRGAGYVLRRED